MISKLFTRSKFAAKASLLILSISLLQSCATYFSVHTEKPIDLKVRQDDVTVEQFREVDNYWNYYPVDSPFVVHASIAKDDFIPMYIHADGYIPKTYVLERKRYNFAPLIDIGIFLGLAGATTIMAEGEEVPGYAAVYVTPALFMIPPAINKKRAKFKKRYSLPSLDPLPKNTGSRSLSVTNISIDIPAGKQVRKVYANYTNFKKSKEATEVKSNRGLNIENSELQHRLNYLLTQTGHIDTTRKIYSSAFKEGSVSGKVIGVKEIFVGQKVQFEISTQWTLTNNVTETEVTSSIFRTPSFWGHDFMQNDKLAIEMIHYSLKSSLFQFLSEPSVSQFLNDESKLEEELYAKWKPIAVNSIGKTARNVIEAKDAVVTVKSKEGHGSGFFVSNDGYLITNHHVIAGQKENLTVVLDDDVELKAEFIRSNPVYDLALLKIDSSNLPFLRLSNETNFEDGTDIYAIGTPQHVDLLKTVSAGVLSAQRLDKKQVVLQTDVRINQGNSGGPMILPNGEVIGVVNAKLIGAGVEGISFAIPSSYIKDVLKLQL